ncbi:MAG: hypothetical protein U0M42_07500 [Acutalibacteraceae bacterium]|nr:hypothetical protein [Acutalibacteraceae bacterium]
MKNKMMLYIAVLQVAFVLLAAALLYAVKMFFPDTFSMVKEQHRRYFEQETIIEQMDIKEDMKA